MATPQHRQINCRGVARCCGSSPRDGALPQLLASLPVAAVANFATRVEEACAIPQDIERAEVDGQIVLLQARPITALPIPPSKTFRGGGWEKDLARVPEPVAPFSGSVCVRHVAPAVAEMCAPRLRVIAVHSAAQADSSSATS